MYGLLDCSLFGDHLATLERRSQKHRFFLFVFGSPPSQTHPWIFASSSVTHPLVQPDASSGPGASSRRAGRRRLSCEGRPFPQPADRARDPRWTLGMSELNGMKGGPIQLLILLHQWQQFSRRRHIPKQFSPCIHTISHPLFSEGFGWAGGWGAHCSTDFASTDPISGRSSSLPNTRLRGGSIVTWAASAERGLVGCVTGISAHTHTDIYIYI